MSKTEKNIKKDVKEVKKELETGKSAIVRKENAIIKPAKGKSKVVSVKALSKYLNALLDPVTAGYGCKIPDTITVPSFPFQAVTRISIPAVQDLGAANPFGYVMGVLFIFGSPGGSPASGIWVLTAFNSIASTSTWIQLPLTSRPVLAQLLALCQAFRIVSAVALVQGQGNYQETGKLTSAFLPSPYSSQIGIPFPAYGAGLDPTQYVEQFAYSNTLTEKVGFGRVLYTPSDVNSLAYQVPGTTTGPWTKPWGMATFAASGMLAPATAGSIHELIVTENYECQPLNSSTTMISATPSPSDPFEMAVATNAIAESPHINTAVTPKEVSTAGAETVSMTGGKGGTLIHKFDPWSNESAPSMMDKIIGGLGSVLDTGTKVAGAVAPLLALL